MLKQRQDADCLVSDCFLQILMQCLLLYETSGKVMCTNSKVYIYSVPTSGLMLFPNNQFINLSDDISYFKIPKTAQN